MALKRSANFDAEVEAEIARLCTEARCDVCLVPISSKEQKDKHYAGKIHAKKLERWKDSFIGQKKAKLEEENNFTDINGSQNYKHEPSSSEEELEKPQLAQMKREVIQENEDPKEESPLASAALDPKLLDQLDPSAMKKMLNLKKKNRWDNPDEEDEDDPNDFSIPSTTAKLMRRCFNRNTGIGYCQICNKLFRNEAEALKHFNSNKHSAKVQIYNEWLASEAAVLAGTAAPNPPPHRGYYCEVRDNKQSNLYLRK